MKTIPRFLIIIFLYLFFIRSWNCTESPFGGDTKISGNSISGTVLLNNDSNNKDIYIWFEELNLSTRTDSNGFFTLNLPSPTQQTGGGIDGIYDLYIYVANYQWHSVKIALAKGKVQHSEQAVDNNGELKGNIILTEILNISTSFSVGSILGDTSRMIFASFKLKAVDDPVAVTTNYSHTIYSGDPEFSTGILLDSTQQFVKLLKREDRELRTGSIEVGTTPGILAPVIIYIDSPENPSGDYQVIPYLLIEQKDLPAGLVSSIGERVKGFNSEFLKIPLRVKNNEIKIVSEIL